MKFVLKQKGNKKDIIDRVDIDSYLEACEYFAKRKNLPINSLLKIYAVLEV